MQLNRRYFLKWLGRGIVAAGAAVLGLAGCGRNRDEPTEPPSARPTRETWRWNVRWIALTPQVDPAQWGLTIDGLVGQGRRLTLEDLRALPLTTIRARMKCVECWSAPAEWTGVAGRDLLSLVQPLTGGNFVTLHALDGYSSTLTVEQLAAERVLFVYGMDGQDLPVQHGFPLRLIAPSKYGYKCVKAIERLEFVDSHVEGYWERRGYENDGTIRPGYDQPLDLGGRRRIAGGEITAY